MKKIAFFSLAVMLTLSACESYDDIIPAEYNKILSIKDGGEQNLTLYNSGEQTEYNITTIKAGADPSQVAQATLSVMNVQQFEAYLAEVGRTFQILPADCYGLADNEMNFTSSDTWKISKLTINPERVKSYLDVAKANGGAEYVIPLILTSPTDSILSTSSRIILKSIEVIKPSVLFQDITDHKVLKEIPATGGKVTLPLGMQIDNLWDFNALVSYDAATSSIPASEFTLENDGKVHFTPGTTGSLDVNFPQMNHAVADIGLKITDIDGKEFDYDPTPVVLTVRVPQYPLTESMISSNATEPSEGSIANLLDGDVNTFFHSAWSVNVDGQHYIQLTLPEAVSKFAFSYTNRAANGNAAMADFTVLAGPDEDHLAEVKHFTKDDDNLPVTGKGVFNSRELVPSEPAKIIRFVHTRNWTGGKFFVWSEFSLFAI